MKSVIHDVVTRAYIGCALWADTPEGEYWTVELLSDEAKERAADEVAAFLWRATPYLSAWTAEQAGHDFWLTRNGHGTGFWDRDMPNGDVLSDIAKSMGEVNLYMGDDGRLYFGG